MMHIKVKDDGPRARTPRGGRHLTPGLFRSLTPLMLLGALAPAAVGQGEETPSFFVAHVIDTSHASMRVTVPINRSIIVKTTSAISRADPVASDIAEVQNVSPTELLITGRGFGRTNIILWDTSNNQYVLDVSVEMDLAALNEAIQELDPQSDAHAKSLFGNIVLTGTASSALRAQRLVDLAGLYVANMPEGSNTKVQNHLDVAGEQQVLLRCVVAEVNRSAARSLGINGFLAGDSIGDGFLVNQLGGINPINIGAAAGAPAIGAIPFLTGGDGIPLRPDVPLSIGFPRAQMQLFIRAMADNSLLRVLAEPNLVAISGETASFLAGGEFPVPVPQGNQTISVQFREFGVRLTFTPEVKGLGLIRLRVEPEVSQLDFSTTVQIGGIVVPGLSTRSASTTVELASGQTIAIAGLLSEEIRGFSTRVPGLGDIPVLGALFRSVEYKRSNSELVIFVTPEIVAPLDPHQVPPLPGASIEDPSDFQLYALGLLEAPEENGESDIGPAPTPGEQAALKIKSDPNELSVHGPWGRAGNERMR